MLIYGIRCPKSVIPYLPKTAVAEYYMDYGILAFPSYSRPTGLTAHGHITSAFWSLVRLIIEHPEQVYAMEFEQPFLEEPDAAGVQCVRDILGRAASPDWYHVPRIADDMPALVVD